MTAATAVSEATPKNSFDPTFCPSDTFVRRHIGPSDVQIAQMLSSVGFDSLEALSDAVVPEAIRLAEPLKLEGLDSEHGEHELLENFKRVASMNQLHRSFIGCGYHGTIVPPVVQRNILENPGWYTQYT
ncbi:MAG: hypothetical protein R3236_11445, partial [Phycisphaeraceae bacterium]|nr:hypothetical protein [Phycisphaeraceae bacterium]